MMVAPRRCLLSGRSRRGYAAASALGRDVAMMCDALLALGLLLSVATQFRLQGSPVGPGVLCLLIWILLVLVREAARLGPPLTPALSRVLIFWALFATAISIGTITAFAIQNND